MKTNNNAVLDNFPQYILSDVGCAVHSPANAHFDAPSSQERSGSDQPQTAGAVSYVQIVGAPRLSGQPRGASIPNQVSCDIPPKKKGQWLRATEDCSPLELGKTGLAERLAATGASLSTATKLKTVRALTSEQPAHANTPETSGTPGQIAGINFVKGFSSFGGLKSRKTKNTFTFFAYSGVSWRSLLFGRVATYWAELMRRTLAPLRRIVSRELEVYTYGRISAHPQSFVVHDRMECGHTHTSLLWDIFDLLNAYTESAHVRAKRHRCDECLTLVQRKPMQSVAAVAKAA